MKESPPEILSLNVSIIEHYLKYNAREEFYIYQNA